MVIEKATYFALGWGTYAFWESDKCSTFDRKLKYSKLRNLRFRNLEHLITAAKKVGELAQKRT
uniref:Uncharacterized protein n=1 Tax=Romanomermis culicivorax TaxID=13658 RepID=A0A915KTF7_ROMCU